VDLFKKSGVKEVADVTFYSILRIGDEEFYIPFLYLDTLKITSLSEKSSTSGASGGYAN
jgi:hypothetical protein